MHTIVSITAIPNVNIALVPITFCLFTFSSNPNFNIASHILKKENGTTIFIKD